MPDTVLTTDLVEAKDAVSRGPAVSVARQIGQLNTVVGQDRVHVIRHGLQEGFQESDGGGPIGFLVQRCEGELRCAVDRDEEVELAFMSSHVSDVDTDEADRVGLERPLSRPVAFDLWQPREAVA